MEKTTPKQSYYRNLMFHVLVVMNCSGCRTGEILNLSRDVVGKLYDGLLCDMKIHGTNTKSKKTRSITVGGLLSGPSEAFRNHNYLWGVADQAFSQGQPGDHAQNIFNKTHGQFRMYLEQFGLGHMQAYSQRHALISDRLRASISPTMIAAHCGTSIRMISQTYSHITGLEASKEIAKKPYVYGGQVGQLIRRDLTTG